MIMDIAGKPCDVIHVATNVQGVRGRNSDNTLIREVLGWVPDYPLRKGIEKTYEWINKQVNG